MRVQDRTKDTWHRIKKLQNCYGDEAKQKRSATVDTFFVSQSPDGLRRRGDERVGEH